MKTIGYFVLTLLFSLNSFFSYGQKGDSEGYTPQVILFANAGIRQLPFASLSEKLDKEGMSTPTFSYYIGASTYFNSKKMLYGLDFYNSFGSSSKTNSTTTHSGLTAGVQVGYKVYENKSFVLAPIIGFSTATNILTIVDESTTMSANARVYKNHDYALKGAIIAEYITPANMSFGLIAGYDYSLNRNSEWEFEGSTVSSNIKENQGGFFISLLIGGHVSLHASH